MINKKSQVLEPVTRNPGHECYEKFLDVVGQRALYGNLDFVTLKQRLHGLSAQDLEENHAVWHRTCYSEVTHKQHTERDKKRYERALTMKDSSVLRDIL